MPGFRYLADRKAVALLLWRERRVEERSTVTWTAIDDALPSDAALICVDGIYYLPILVGGPEDAAFMDLHSSDLLPWPSHWTSLPPLPPG